MKRAITTILLAPLLFTALNAAAHEKPATTLPNAIKSNASADKTALKVNQVIDKLKAAITADDTMLIEEVMSERITIFEQGHAELSRAEYLSHHFKQDVIFARAVSSVVVSSQTSVEGAFALVTMHTTADGIYKDKTIKNAGVETYVLRLQNDRWQIVHVHWSSRKR